MKEAQKGKRKKPHMLPNLLVFGLLRHPRTKADIIHRAYVIYYWRKCRTVGARLSVWRYFFLSPFLIIRESGTWTEKLAAKTASRGHKSLLRQRLEQFYLNFFFSIDSKNYYLQEFFLQDGLKRARNFANKGAMKQGVYSLLGNYGKHLHREAESCSLGRKAEFSAFCLNKGLPVVPVLMEFFADGSQKDYRMGTESTVELPREDLFCKPNVDNEGEGAEVWFWRRNVYYENQRGRRLEVGELREHLFSLARSHHSESILVQPLILPHRELAAFRKVATPTVRVLSYIDPNDDKIKVDRAMLRFSRDPSSVVDNASAGGMVVPVDAVTGKLGAATGSGLDTSDRRWEKHPDSGAQIQGQILPFWPETIALVRHAHNFFPQRLIIGWDVVLTAAGPVLLEGNSQPGLCFLQKAHRKPVGEMEIGRAMALYTKKAIKVLYNGLIPHDPEKQDAIDLYDGSRVKRLLSWLLVKNVKAIHLVIYGKVQGVFYRKWLHEKANRLKLDGWVRNQPEGTVEVVLKGRAVDLEDLVRSCWFGPKSAKVKLIQANWYVKPVGKGFIIKK